MLEIVVELVVTDARIRAEISPKGTATTRIALAIVTKLRRYTLNDASSISPTDRGRSTGTPVAMAPITQPYRSVEPVLNWRYPRPTAHEGTEPKCR